MSVLAVYSDDNESVMPSPEGSPRVQVTVQHIKNIPVKTKGDATVINPMQTATLDREIEMMQDEVDNIIVPTAPQGINQDNKHDEAVKTDVFEVSRGHLGSLPQKTGSRHVEAMLLKSPPPPKATFKSFKSKILETLSTAQTRKARGDMARERNAGDN